MDLNHSRFGFVSSAPTTEQELALANLAAEGRLNAEGSCYTLSDFRQARRIAVAAGLPTDYLDEEIAALEEGPTIVAACDHQ